MPKKFKSKDPELACQRLADCLNRLVEDFDAIDTGLFLEQVILEMAQRRRLKNPLAMGPYSNANVLFILGDAIQSANRSPKE